MPYDVKCYDLAGAFLHDTPDINSASNRDKLAQHIQTAIEDWIGYEQAPCKMCGKTRGSGDHSLCHMMP